MLSSLIFVILAFVSGCATPKTGLIAFSKDNSKPVYYSGFTYAAQSKEVESSYGITKKLNEGSVGAGEIDLIFKDLFSTPWTREYGFDTKTGLSDLCGNASDSMAMTIVVTREDFGLEPMNNDTKVVLNLGVKLMFVDMSTRSFIWAYPVNIEIVDSFEGNLGNVEFEKFKKSILLNAYQKAASVLKSSFPVVNLKNVSLITLQVSNSVLQEKARDGMFGTDKQANAEEYSKLVAQSFSDELVRKFGLTMLPFRKDLINGRVGVRCSNNKSADFKVPDMPSFAVDLSLNNVKKKQVQQTNAERGIGYGAFLGVKVLEPEYTIVVFDKEIFNGAIKAVAITSGEPEDLPVYKELVQKTIIKAVDELGKDKNFDKKVLTLFRAN